MLTRFQLKNKTILIFLSRDVLPILQFRINRTPRVYSLYSVTKLDSTYPETQFTWLSESIFFAEYSTVWIYHPFLTILLLMDRWTVSRFCPMWIKLLPSSASLSMDIHFHFSCKYWSGITRSERLWLTIKGTTRPLSKVPILFSCPITK